MAAMPKKQTTMTAYAARLAELQSTYSDYSWERTEGGGHVLDVYGPAGDHSHEHYRRDGSAYWPIACGCFTRRRG